jgi:hypothetical protein
MIEFSQQTVTGDAKEIGIFTAYDYLTSVNMPFDDYIRICLVTTLCVCTHSFGLCVTRRSSKEREDTT